MKRSILTVLMICVVAMAGRAQTITGVVTNGTTDKPAGGDTVTLIKLGQGMEEVATSKTNGRGEFKINGNDPKAPYLLRVRHDDVNYHQPVRPGVSTVQMMVYDAASRVQGIRLEEQSEIFQAAENKVQVFALFQLSNNSSPKLTQPRFEFYLPEGADVRMGQALTESGMPVQSPPVPRAEKGKFAMEFPIRPGVTQFEVAYILPYAGSLSVHPRLTMTAGHYYVITPKGISFAAKGKTNFRQTDVWPTEPRMTGVDIHTAENVSPGEEPAYEISGTGTLPNQAAGGDQGQQSAQQSQSQEDNRPGGGLGVPNEKPDPLHSGQWVFLGVLTLFLAAGATFVYTSNRPGVVSARKPQDQGGLLMEAMKEEIFLLETDRLQGKLSVKEYESAKAALDKTLQRAVQRQKA